MDNPNNLNDSAILFLDNNQSVTTSATTSSNLNGHDILDQVQRELQFLPSTNDNAFVTGTIHDSGATSTSVVTGTMESVSRTNRDTDFLVGSDSIDLNSPVSIDINDSSATASNAQSDKKYSVWQFEFYAKYFNLSTDIFFRRVLWSLLPLTGGNKGTYIERHIQSNPDLFGPFWIPLTLAFTISLCDDIIRYLNLHQSVLDSISFNHSETQLSTKTLVTPAHIDIDLHPLAFHFTRINLATVITFTYITLAPLILWSFCQWRHCTRLYTFLECLCSYGYSLSVFIPVAILCLVNIRQLQFILVASGAFLSGSVLLISFAPVVHSDPSKSFKFAYLMLIFILTAHFILALFYLYIFL